MPTYTEYLVYAKSKGFQPLAEDTFKSLLKAKFNPITNQFIKG